MKQIPLVSQRMEEIVEMTKVVPLQSFVPKQVPAASCRSTDGCEVPVVLQFWERAVQAAKEFSSADGVGANRRPNIAVIRFKCAADPGA